MSKLAEIVKQAVEDGYKLANQTTLSMDEINAKVTAINEAITIIDQIAFQTNILSLNAAVEAATAGEAVVLDMFGNEHFVKDIEVITTDNAMKWLKFDISYETWCEKVNDNNNLFGIVKTPHKSKLGDVQQMSYQMINSLDMHI
jgi:hypothetical protein